MLALVTAAFGGLGGAGGAGGPPPPADALTVFDGAARLLRTHYAGPGMGEVDGLLTAQRQLLTSRCTAAAASPCPVPLGRAAVDTVLSTLGDRHTSVRWDAPPLNRTQAPTVPTYVWSGLLTQLMRPGVLRVVHVDHGSPAERAGVRPGDLVLNVGGRDDLDDVGLRSSFLEAAEEAGKPFVLRVRRGGAVRALTVTPASWPAWGQPSLRWEDRVAVISVPNFAVGTGAAFGRLVTRAVQQGAAGLVVDLRWNPGGLADECLGAAYSLAGEAVNVVGIGRSGQAVYEWRTSASAQKARQQTPVRWKGPLALLVTSQTFSCGEVLAYFGQRAGGTVVGSPTGGVMTSVVKSYDVPGGGVISLSSGRPTLDGRVRLPERVQPDVTEPTVADQEETDTALQEALRVVRRR